MIGLEKHLKSVIKELKTTCTRMAKLYKIISDEMPIGEDNEDTKSLKTFDTEFSLDTHYNVCYIWESVRGKKFRSQYDFDEQTCSLLSFDAEEIPHIETYLFAMIEALQKFEEQVINDPFVYIDLAESTCTKPCIESRLEAKIDKYKLDYNL